MITVKGKLLHGVAVDGATHVDFEMREAKIRDVILASDKLINAGEDATSNLVARIYTAAEQLEKLGDLPKEQITGELLMNLSEDDIFPLIDAQDDLKKKRSNAKAA